MQRTPLLIGLTPASGRCCRLAVAGAQTDPALEQRLATGSRRCAPSARRIRNCSSVAYKRYPRIARGQLEALAWVQTRWSTPRYDAGDNHLELPRAYGVMGLYRGEGFDDQVGRAAQSARRIAASGDRRRAPEHPRRRGAARRGSRRRPARARARRRRSPRTRVSRRRRKARCRRSREAALPSTYCWRSIAASTTTACACQSARSNGNASSRPTRWCARKRRSSLDAARDRVEVGRLHIDPAR